MSPLMLLVLDPEGAVGEADFPAGLAAAWKMVSARGYSRCYEG